MPRDFGGSANEAEDDAYKEIHYPIKQYCTQPERLQSIMHGNAYVLLKGLVANDVT